MSWSLEVSNGDLSIGANGLNAVSGGAKLLQDLRCALLERMGTDSLHPSYGSTLDGGIDAHGIVQPSLIGYINDAETSTLIQSEIHRICQAYQGQQIARNAADVATYGKSTLTVDEALLEVSGMNVQRAKDHVLVGVKIQTGAGSASLNLPFSAS